MPTDQEKVAALVVVVKLLCMQIEKNQPGALANFQKSMNFGKLPPEVAQEIRAYLTP